MALEAPPGSARRQRQGSLARAAYDAVVYHSEQVCLSAVDQERLDVALEDLRIALGRLAHPTPRTPPP